MFGSVYVIMNQGVLLPSVEPERICSQVTEGVCVMIFYLYLKVLLSCALLAFVALSLLY